MEEEIKTSTKSEKKLLTSIVFTKSETNLAILTLLYSKNTYNLILSSHNLCLYSIDLHNFECSSLNHLFFIPDIFGNAFTLLEMQKSDLILSGHESGSILVFKWQSDRRKLINIKTFESNYYKGMCFSLLGFQHTEFIIHSNWTTDYLNVLKVNHDVGKPKFHYSIKFEKKILTISILDDEALQSFACSFSDNTIKLFFSVLEDKKNLKTTELNSFDPITSLSYQRTKKMLFGSTSTGFIYVWDLSEFKLIFKVNNTSTININSYILPNEDGFSWRLLQMFPEEVTLTEYEGLLKKSTVSLFPKMDVPNIEESKFSLLIGHRKWVKYLFSFTTYKNQHILLSSSEDRTMKSWDLQELKLLDGIRVHFMYIYVILNVKKQGVDLIVTAAADCKIKIWEYETKKIRKELLGHERPVHCLVYNEDLDHLISGSNDYSIRVWNFTTYENVKILNFHTDRVRNLILLERVHSLGSRDLLLSFSDDGRINVWDGKSYESVQKFHEQNGATIRASFIFKFNGMTFLLTSTYPSLIRIWNMHTFKCLKKTRFVMEKEVTALNLVIFRGDPVMLLGCATSKIRMVEFFSNETIMDVCLKNGWTREILFIPEKSLLMASCWNNDIACWKIKKTKEKEYDHYFKRVEMVKIKNDRCLFCIYDGGLYYMKL